MSLYLVAHDLKKGRQSYECISMKLEALGPYWHIQQSVWLVTWSGSAYDLANDLAFCLDNNDDLFVTQVTSDSAWSHDDEDTAWLRSNI